MSWGRKLNATVAAYMADLHGVTVEHLRETIKARRLFRRGRRWHKPMTSKRRGNAAERVSRRRDDLLLAGEGELHGLLKALKMKPVEFYTLVGVRETTFLRWYGHPLHPWPIEFLRYYGRAQAMGRYLEAQGVDLEQFEPKLPPRSLGPQFPRGPVKQPQAIPKLPDKPYSPWLKKPSTEGSEP